MAVTVNNDELLYASFLDDHRTYQLVVSYWHRLFKEILANTELPFQPFYNKHYKNGQKDYSANPIFDAYFPDRHKLVRIIQYLPESGDRLFSAYIEHWPIANMTEEQRPCPTDPSQALQPIPELVIALALTKETSVTAEELIQKWVKEDVSEIEMKKNIDLLE